MSVRTPKHAICQTVMLSPTSVLPQRSRKDKASGEKREITEWHRLVFYRKLAELVSSYVKKGGQLYVEGRIRTRKWQDKEGQERYTTEIEVTENAIVGRPSKRSI